MSTAAEKRKAIEYIASQIHTGSPNDTSAIEAVQVLLTGKSSTVAAPATTFDYVHTDQDEYLKLTGLTGATTINLTSGGDIGMGAILTIDVVQGATGRNLVLGTNIEGADLVGVANDRDVIVLKYTATNNWVLVSNTKIIDAA